MFNFKSSLIVLFISISVSTSWSSVWTEKEAWTPEWEDKFSSWVNNEFNDDIFISGKYKGIPTDCADAVYFSRLIFANENQLPFVIKDPTGGSSNITNKMSRFDSTKDPHQRLRQFMLFIANVTGTRSLANDSYPVKINRNNVRPGTIWSRPRIKRENVLNMIFGGDVKEDPGHAEVVKDVNEAGAIELLGSTVPIAIRKLQTTSYLVFLPIETTTGFRRWYLPEEYKKKTADLPNFSLEQFKMGVSTSTHSKNIGNNQLRNLERWSTQVQNRLKLKNESKEEALQRAIKDLCTLANSRVDIVRKGEAIRRNLKNSCMNANSYENYSTPSRDKRIMITLERAVKIDGGFGFTLNQQMNKLEPLLKTCEIEIQTGRKIALWNFLKAIANDNVSSNPNDSFDARWGLAEPEDKDCPEY